MNCYVKTGKCSKNRNTTDTAVCCCGYMPYAPVHKYLKAHTAVRPNPQTQKILPDPNRSTLSMLHFDENTKTRNFFVDTVF